MNNAIATEAVITNDLGTNPLPMAQHVYDVRVNLPDGGSFPLIGVKSDIEPPLGDDCDYIPIKKGKPYPVTITQERTTHYIPWFPKRFICQNNGGGSSNFVDPMLGAGSNPGNPGGGGPGGHGNPVGGDGVVSR